MVMIRVPVVASWPEAAWGVLPAAWLPPVPSGAAELPGSPAVRVVITLVGQGVPRGFVTDPPQDGLGEAGKCGGRHGPNLFISGRFSCLGFGVWRCTAVVSCRGVPEGCSVFFPSGHVCLLAGAAIDAGTRQ